MSYSYVWDGGSYDFPDPPDYSPADDEWDEFVIEVESFQAHYYDEINGYAEPLADDVPALPVELRNAPGQLRLNLGAAY